MEVIYYLLIITLVIFIPALVIFVLLGLINPKIVNKRTKKNWSRGRIFVGGVAVLCK